MSDLKCPDSSRDRDFLAGGGEMTRLVHSKDWTDTPLGPIEAWPQSLRTTVSLCLASNFPIDIVWGPRHTQIYNDGYRVVCGEGHPAILGMDFTVAWASAWPVIGEPFARAMAGESSFLENQRIFIRRNGYLEETFFTFSFSPIRDETGGIGGLFHPVTETTATMLGERRTRAVRDLTMRLSAAKSADEVLVLAADTLASFDLDLPFVLFYQLERPGDGQLSYKLVAHTGLAAETPVTPATLALDSAVPWPINDLIRSTSVAELKGLTGLFGGVPCGPYEEPCDAAFGSALWLPGSDLPAAIMIAGASSRLPLNDVYKGFYDLVAAAVGAGLANARAYEEERKRAEALAAIDRAKTAFFSNVSHEFRTPLTLMLGPLEDALAEVDSLSPLQHQRLEVAHRNALRLLRLVNSLLDFSRIEAGRARAHFEPVEVAGLTAAVASNFRSACERAGLELLVDCQPLEASLYVDTDMWEKIVLNLVSNAFKFTLQGGITVAVHKVDAAVQLVVRDTGVGIPAVELPRVFERFHRIEGQPGRTYEGTGIGLALVQELVKLHGGTIGVSSTPGHGTEFRVTIPTGTAHLSPDDIRSDAAAPPARIGATAFVEEAIGWLPNQGSLGSVHPEADLGQVSDRPRIILADDNADMRDHVTGILARGGYEVEAVKDGWAALAAARRGPHPDLILTDVMMPGLDGFALLRELRADPVMEGILVILLSARAGEEARIEGLAAGADDYLIKPFSARELRARVDGAINLARQRRQAAERERDLLAELATERGLTALRLSEERLEFALQAGRLGRWELDLVTGRLEVSDICRASFGIGPSERVETQEDLLCRIHPDDLEARSAAVSKAISTGGSLDIEYRTVWPNGHVAWVQMRGEAFLAQDATPLRMVGVSMDVTRRKQAETEREKANADLTQLSSDLAKAVEAADQANRAKSRFLAGVTHELRTPLNGILGHAHLLHLEGGLNAEQGERVNAMLEAGKHLLELITDVLDLSQIESECTVIQAVEFDVRSVASTCLDLVRHTAEAGGLALELTMAPGTPPLWVADPVRLRQILVNLLGNAVKFTKHGAVTLHVLPSPNGSALRFEVADTGPGVSAEYRQYLFQEFQRLDTKITRSVEGVGLGLALSNRLAKLMGGSLGYADNPGGGSLFWLELISDTVTIPASMTPPAVDSAEAEPRSAPVRALDVLVVDDVLMNREIASSFLHMFGHNVTCAEGGAEAVAAASTTDFDIVLMDVRMPEMDGLEATRRIRALDGPRARVPIIALTAQAFTDQVAACGAAGMDGHLAKPFDPETLRTTIERVAGSGPSDVRPPISVPMMISEVAVAAVPLIGLELTVWNLKTFERTAGMLAPAAVADYLRTIAEQAGSLKRALCEPDAVSRTGDVLGEAAHKLAGSAGMLGFDRLASVGRQFEKAVQSLAADVPELTNSLAAAIEASLESIRDYTRVAVDG